MNFLLTITELAYEVLLGRVGRPETGVATTADE